MDTCRGCSAQANQSLPLPTSLSVALPQGSPVRPGERPRDARPGQQRLFLGALLSEVPAAGLGRPAPEGHSDLLLQREKCQEECVCSSVSSLPSVSYFSPSHCLSLCPSVSLSAPRLQIPQSYSNKVPQTGKAPAAKTCCSSGNSRPLPLCHGAPVQVTRGRRELRVADAFLRCFPKAIAETQVSPSGAALLRETEVLLAP